MKHKKLFLTTCFFVAAAAVMAAATFIVKGIEILNNQIDFQLEEAAKRVMVDYQGKANTEVSNVNENQVLFTNYDQSKYDVILLYTNPVRDKPDTVRVRFIIKNKILNLESEVVAVNVVGFLVPTMVPGTTPTTPPTMTPTTVVRTKRDLDNLVNNVDKIWYDGDKRNVLVRNMVDSKIVFTALPDDVSSVINSVSEKEWDSSKAVVSFKLKLNNSNIESKSKSLEIPGFKFQEIVKPVDELADSIVVEFPKKVSDIIIDANEIDQLIPRFSGYDINKYQVIEKKVMAAPGQDSFLKTKFKLKSKADGAVSNERTIKVTGFRVRKTPMELDSVARDVRLIPNKDYADLIKNKKLDEITPRFYGYDPTFYKITDLTKSLRGTDTKPTLALNFRIQEVGTKTKSDVWTLEIDPFKVDKTKEELNAELNKVTVNTDLYNKAKTSISDISSDTKFDFRNIDKNKYDVVGVTFESKHEDKSVLQIKFSIKEIYGRIQSDERTIEIPGFKIETDFEDLNTVLSNVNVTVPREYKKYPIGSNVKEIKPDYNGLDLTKYDVVDIEKSQSPSDKSILIFKFKIQEKNGRSKSSEKIVEIPGFRKSKTLEELNEVLDIAMEEIEEEFRKVPSTNVGNTMSPDFKRFDGSLYEIESKKLEAKENNPTILVYKARIKEKGGLLFSDEKSIDVSAFDVWGNVKLNDKVDNVHVNFMGDRSKFFASQDSIGSLIVFDNYDKNAYDLVETKFEVNERDPSLLEVSYKLREKFRGLLSYNRTTYLTGFKVLKDAKELNTVLNGLSASFAGDKTKTLLEGDLNNLKIIISNSGESIYEVIGKTITKKVGSPSTAVVKFRIKEKYGKILSDEKTLEVTGFKTLKTASELNAIASSITATRHTEEKYVVETDDFNELTINLYGYDTDEYQIVDKKIIRKPNSKNTAQVKFKIKQKDGTILSSEKTLDVTGYEILTPSSDLDAPLEKMRIAYRGDKNKLKPEDLNNISLDINNLDAKYKVVKGTIVEKPNAKSWIVVKLRINEVGTSKVSKERTFEISGFKVWKSETQLNEIARKVTVSFEGAKENYVISDNQPKDKIKFDNFDDKIYEITNLVVKEKTIDKSVLEVEYKIKEKNGRVKSESRSVNIRGFKVKTI